MDLINLIGWFCSAINQPVEYSVSYFSTVLHYMSNKKVVVNIYDKRKKRRRVTPRVPTDERDTRKTKLSTCVNFIHQRDAYIAMNVVGSFTKDIGELLLNGLTQKKSISK